MIKKMLKEDTVKQAVRDADTPEEKKDIADAGSDLDSPEVSDDSGQIERDLNRALRINRRNRDQNNRNFLNLLFVGEAGTGKTARIQSWARKNGINLVTLKAGELDDTDTGGVIAGNIQTQVAVRLASTEFDQLEEQNSVLFLDEWNRAPSTVRQSLLTLIQNHTVTDPRVKGRMRYLPNFLFTVAAINPADDSYDTDQLDQAELGRVSTKTVQSSVANWKYYMTNYYGNLAKRAKNPQDKLVRERQVNLASAIADIMDKRNSGVKFDDAKSRAESKDDSNWNGLLLTPRTLTNAIEESEGEKDVFLDVYSDNCNNRYKNALEAELGDYHDIEDHANDALKNYTPKNDKMFKDSKQLAADELDALAARSRNATEI